MITIKFINPLIQFGKKNFDLVVTDSENRFPPFRVGKKYPENYSKIQIANDLKKTFTNYLDELRALDPPQTTLTWNDLKGNQVTIDKIGGTKDTFVTN